MNRPRANLVIGLLDWLKNQVSFRRTFVSNVLDGTGSATEILHGLPSAPDKFIVVPHGGHNGSGAAGTQMPTFVVGTVDATKITVTATAGSKYYVVAWDA